MADKTEEQRVQVKEKVISILQEKLQCPCQEVNQYLDEPLTGSPFFLAETGMVYLLFEVEKQFGIQMEEKELLEYGFSTINQVTDLVVEHMVK